jgi:hypothetical protein
MHIAVFLKKGAKNKAVSLKEIKIVLWAVVKMQV